MLQGSFSDALVKLRICPEQPAVFIFRLVGIHLLADYLCPKLTMEPPFWVQGKLSELLKKWHLLAYRVDGFDHCFLHNLLLLVTIDVS